MSPLPPSNILARTGLAEPPRLVTNPRQWRVRRDMREPPWVSRQRAGERARAGRLNARGIAEPSCYLWPPSQLTTNSQPADVLVGFGVHNSSPFFFRLAARSVSFLVRSLLYSMLSAGWPGSLSR